MLTKSEAETGKIARLFAKSLQPGDIVALHGDLGAGKTTFVRAVVEEIAPENFVQSPTFTYLNIYEGKLPLYHFDLYRIANQEIFVQMGFLDYLFENEGICFIEWPQRISSLLPEKTKHVVLTHEENGGRMIDVR